MVIHLSYNVAARSDLVGLGQLVDRLKPDYVFLQEVAVSKEHLEAHLGREYNCQVNIEPDSSKPGSAVAWRSGMEVQVVPMVPARMQRLETCHGVFINVYANSGTKGEAARRVLFGQDLVSLIAVDPQAVLIGDWNCLTRKEDKEFPQRYSRKVLQSWFR